MMIRKQSPDTLHFLFGFIMAVLFYAPCFTMQFVCTLPKAPGLPGGRLSGTAFQAKRQNMKKTVSTLFTILMRNVLILKIFCVHQRGKRLFPASV